MLHKSRTPIGVWSELGPGARWANEGVSRVVGFLVEGAALGDKYIFHIVVPRGMAPTVRKDLRPLKATEGLDWLVWEPSDEQESSFAFDDEVAATLEPHEVGTARLAELANDHVPVDAWVVTFPHFSGSLLLNKPKAVLFPDALPYDFPLGWPEDWGPDGPWPKWRKTATEVMAASDAVITFSEHVARRHATPLLNVSPDKVRVVPLAPPDLGPVLSFIIERRRTPDSRARAAAILRRHMADQGVDYLRGFPFDEIDYVAAATQDRPTKNLGLTAEAVRRIVRVDRRSMKYLLTAPLHFGADWTRLPRIVEHHQFHRDLVSLPDLPRDVHAALFHCASMVVHSSFFEGIIGALPFYEAVSIGTPVLLARGPHIDELLATEPDMAPFVFDPYDVVGLAELIKTVAASREEVVEAQAAVHLRLMTRSWEAVASEYAEAALSGVQASSPFAHQTIQ